jgi:hypothetical protein
MGNSPQIPQQDMPQACSLSFSPVLTHFLLAQPEALPKHPVNGHAHLIQARMPGFQQQGHKQRIGCITQV